MIVIDASALLEVLLRTPRAAGIEARVFAADASLHAPHQLFLPRIWALRRNVTAYDAVYIALAEALDATLLTCDQRLASAPGHTARVDVVQGAA